MLYLLFFLPFGFAWGLGYAAFTSGLAVKRWALLGACLGPIAYPLFTTHKHLAYRRITRGKELTLRC